MSPAAGDFDGKTVVVSGASSGIGRAISVELGRRGARVVLVGRNRAELDQTAALLPGGSGVVLELDLGLHDEIVPAVRDVAKSGGRVYGLCHSAGVVETLPLSASPAARVQAMMEVNYLAGMELARAVSRRDVMEPDGGAILFMSSIYALIGMPGQIAYSGSKGAVKAAARSMAIELARRNIRVNVLSPGMVRTEMTDGALGKLAPEQVQALEDQHPLGFGRPEDIAQAAAFLLSPASRWITGTDLVVDGGRSAH